MEQLEKGNSFNLQEALHYKLADADYRIRLNRTLRHILIWLEAAVAVAIVIALCVVIGLIAALTVWDRSPGPAWVAEGTRGF